jgi:hypothetical protein
VDIQKVIKEIKAQFKTFAKKAEAVLKVSADAGKQAFEVVTGNAQGLAEVQTSAAKDLVQVAKTSFEKAREAGLKEVAASPVDYLPVEGKDRVVAAAQDTYELLTETAEELAAVLKKGYKSIMAKLTQKPVTRKPAKRVARKPVSKKAAAAAA